MPTAIARHVMFVLRAHPEVADRWGHHVRPIHFYEPLPDFRGITAEAAGRRRVSASVDFDIEGQRRLVRRLGDSYRAEIEALAASGAFDFANEYFAGLDAAMYYAIIRDVKPARVVEIGSGMSTRIAAVAIGRNRAEGHAGEIVCVEPFPQPRLTENMPAVTLIERPVEKVELETFDTLQLAFNEQYLLEAFLSFNHAYAVRAANSWLALDYRREAETLAPAGLWPGPELGCGSFWMQRVA